ncbi:MAG: carbohydrate ABC transporter permease [Spirochaetes bacterium]|nr:carbohydrate ABC transporter permease [Spirochaetota bacterium]
MDELKLYDTNKIRFNKKLVVQIILHTCYVLIGITMLYPLLWLLLASFKTQAEIFATTNILSLPKKWLISNYIEGWKGFGNETFGTYFLNTIIVASLSALGSVINSSLVGFGFARTRFVGKGILFSMMLATMMIPYPIIMIPQYLIYQKLRLVDTFVPLILPSWLGTPFFIFLVTQFMRGIPKELDESAVIDGCSKFGLYFRILLPLSQSALMTVAIFSFYWRWNDFIQPLIYLNKPKLYTLSIALRLFADPTSVTNWGAMFAMSVLSIIPVFFVFFFLQRHVTQGISTTGLKG